MATNDIYTMTPGSAVAETIQGLLQQRRAEARQAMLDKLNEENVRSQMGERQQRLMLDSAEEERARQNDLETVMRNRVGMLPDAANVSDIQDPQLVEYLRKTGQVQQMPGATPRVSTSTAMQPPQDATPEQLETWAQSMEANPSAETTVAGPDLPPSERFRGSRDFQSEERQRGYIDQYIKDNPDVAKNKPLLEALAAKKAGAIENVAPQLFGGNRKGQIISHTGRQMGSVPLGPYDEIVEMNQPYQMNATLGPKAYQEIDRNTQRVIRTHILTPDQAAVLSETLASTGGVLVPTTAPFAPGAAQERAKDVASRAFSAAFTSNAPRAQRIAELNQARTNLISSTITTDPAIKSDLSALSEKIMAAVEAKGGVPANTVDFIMQSIKQNHPTMTPADETEVMETLNMLLTNIPKLEQ